MGMAEAAALADQRTLSKWIEMAISAALKARTGGKQ
jgi:hypothetical protein